jgi:hypothetical protein
MLVVGYGIGIVMPCSLVSIQNAAERRDVGAATGAFLFLRSMGGAIGSTLAGVVLAGRFAALNHAGGVNIPIDLGALRSTAGAAAALDAHTLAIAEISLSGGFHAAFAACSVLAVAAFAACWTMDDVALKTSG